MNRRTFSALAVAGLVSPRSIAAKAQSGSSDSSLIISETTGAEVDISRTSFELVSQRSIVADDFVFEVVQLENDLGMVWLQFITGAGRFDFSNAYQRSRSSFTNEPDEREFEEMGAQEVDGGGWMAFLLESDLNTYSELQEEAFPDANLWVEVQAINDNFAAAVDEIQKIDLAGMPPFLFLEESAAQHDLFATSSSTNLIGRHSTSNRSTSNSSIGSDGSTEGGDVDVVAAVRAHQAQFHDEKARFEDVLQRMADGELVGEAEMEMFTVMLEVTFSWTEAPGIAAELTFPSELANLESIYLEWADAVGQMGVTLGEWSTGNGTVDDFIDATSAAVQVDAALSAQLRTLGASPAAAPGAV